MRMSTVYIQKRTWTMSVKKYIDNLVLVILHKTPVYIVCLIITLAWWLREIEINMYKHRMIVNSNKMQFYCIFKDSFPYENYLKYCYD